MPTYNAYAAKSAKAPLEPFSFDPGELGPEEVEIKVTHCGLCHSDLSMLDNEWGMSNYPFVPGHEVVGTVSALGEEAKGLKIGQKVGLGWFSHSCLSCHECLSGDHNLCSTAQGTIVGRHGGFADRVRAQWTWVRPLPEGLDMAKTGPLLCGGVTVFAPLLIFAGTQKIDQKLLRPAQVGEFKIDLPSKTIGHETDPLVGGKVTSVDGVNVEGFTLELVNNKTHWRSGKITLRSDGAFVANLFAEKLERNVFSLELHDPSGVRQKSVPDHLIYTVGVVIDEQPLINSIGIALIDNTMEIFFEKGLGLPIKSKATLRIANAVAAGSKTAAVIMPLIEGENKTAADRNRVIGQFAIPGEEIKRDLPSGTEVELTLRMDEKRDIKVNVYIQALDLEFDYELKTAIKQSTDVPAITRAFTEAIKRLRELLTQAGDADDKKSVAELEKLQASELVTEIKQSLISANTDPGAAEQCEKRLLEFQLALDGVETQIKWPTLVIEAFMMDQKVKDIERAKYWAAYGFNFDPNVMQAFMMDQKVKDVERAKYWKARGYNFDPDTMQAFMMDQKVKDIERAKYWAAYGFNFDPNVMQAFMMDQKVKDIQRAQYWKTKGYSFDPDVMSAFMMDQEAAKTATSVPSAEAPEPANQTDTPIVKPPTLPAPNLSPLETKPNYTPPPDVIVPVLKPILKVPSVKLAPAIVRK